MKSVALPSALSACMGITEPAIFGVNLRLGRPFIAACAGGACGALYASIVNLGATGTGVTGIFGILLHLHRPMQYIIAMAIAFGVAFVLTGILGFKEETEEIEETIEERATEQKQTEKEICSPICGEVTELSEIPDPTFASGALGEGVGVRPSEGKVYAPFDGTVATVFNTKHAIGLESEDQIELLVHVGLETVSLNGAPFTVHVESGQKVKEGDLLLEFDMEQIKAAGLETITPIIITNPGAYEKVMIKARS